MDVPKPIIDAINTMLAPYGKTYRADEPEPVVKRISGPRFLSVSDAMAYSGMTRWNIWNHARQGHFRTQKTGAHRSCATLIDKESFDEWLSGKQNRKETERK